MKKNARNANPAMRTKIEKNAKNARIVKNAKSAKK